MSPAVDGFPGKVCQMIKKRINPNSVQPLPENGEGSTPQIVL